MYCILRTSSNVMCIKIFSMLVGIWNVKKFSIIVENIRVCNFSFFLTIQTTTRYYSSPSTTLNQRDTFHTDNFFCETTLDRYRKKYLGTDNLTITERLPSSGVAVSFQGNLGCSSSCGWSGHFSRVDEKDLQQKAFIVSLRCIHSWFPHCHYKIHLSIHILLCHSSLT